MGLIDIENADHRRAWWNGVKAYIKNKLRAKPKRFEGETFTSLNDIYKKFGSIDAGKNWGRHSAPPVEVVEFIRQLYPEADNIAMTEGRSAEMKALLLEEQMKEMVLRSELDQVIKERDEARKKLQEDAEERNRLLKIIETIAGKGTDGK